MLFHEASVWQERNEHNLMRDFRDEVPVYLKNREIGTILERLDLPAGGQHVGANLHRCYEALVSASIIDPREIPLLEAWLADVARVTTKAAAAGA